VTFKRKQKQEFKERVEDDREILDYDKRSRKMELMNFD
jgi:hypothetical protein